MLETDHMKRCPWVQDDEVRAAFPKLPEVGCVRISCCSIGAARTSLRIFLRVCLCASHAKFSSVRISTKQTSQVQSETCKKNTSILSKSFLTSTPSVTLQGPENRIPEASSLTFIRHAVSGWISELFRAKNACAQNFEQRGKSGKQNITRQTAYTTATESTRRGQCLLILNCLELRGPAAILFISRDT